MKADDCHGGDGGLKGSVTLLQVVVATMATTNAQLTTEVAGLHAEVARLAAIQSPTGAGLNAEITRLHAEVARLAVIQSPATSKANLQDERIATTGDGSGAGSPGIYQEIIKRNWHGRLGRAHMADVDRMLDAAKKELDCYLRRTIRVMLPVGGNYTEVNPDTLFATLSAFGLRLEDRGPLADVTIFTDAARTEAPTINRLQNWSAFYYTNNGTYGSYWRGSAMETLLELARYRGLFDAGGFLKVVD